MAMEIQQRDVQILKFVFACRVASYGQLINRFFAKNNESIAYRRIEALCDAGLLIPRVDLEFKKSIKFVSVSEKAWDKLSGHWPFLIDSPYFKSESVFHDMRMNEIFFRFEKLKSYRSFLTENLLQSSSFLQSDLKYRDLAKLYADGALVTSGKEDRLFVYGIELEISKKSPERYKEKLSAYYRADGIDGVLYIAGNQEIINTITRVDAEVRESKGSIVYSALEFNALNSETKMIFQNGNTYAIELL